MWSCRGFLISDPFQGSLLRDLGAGTYEDAVVLETTSSSFFLSLGSLCYPVSFVCAAGQLDRVTSTPHLPRPRRKLETVFLGFQLPCSASESLLKLFLLFGAESSFALSRPNELLWLLGFCYIHSQALKVRQNGQL